MSEERTQAPSKKRRQQARESGQAAHSPMLTAAAGLLASLLLLGLWGGSLARTLSHLALRCFGGSPWELDDPAVLTELLRETALSLAMPVGGLLLGTALAMVLVHQLQVGGLWAPSQLAPDPSRLWGGFQNSSRQVLQSGWTLLKVVSLATLAAWLIVGRWPALERLAAQDIENLAVSGSMLLVRLLQIMAVSLLALGLADFFLRWRQFEEQLCLTPEQQKQELRETDGDPAVRARQRSVALAWRKDPADLLPGAAMVVTAGAGLAILLAGEKPPGPIAIRQIARGVAASALRNAATRAGLTIADAPPLALYLARGQREALPPHHAEALGKLWPEERPRVS